MNVLSPDCLRLRPAPGGIGTRRPGHQALIGERGHRRARLEEPASP